MPVTRRWDLVVAGRPHPWPTSSVISRTAASYANGSGSSSSEKASALDLAGRWDDAAEHARHHNGIGDT